MMTLGYGLGSLGLGATYYFMSAYFVVFLTNCVGLNPTAATSISALALMVEVVYGMTVGSFPTHVLQKWEDVSLSYASLLLQCCQ